MRNAVAADSWQSFCFCMPPRPGSYWWCCRCCCCRCRCRCRCCLSNPPAFCLPFGSYVFFELYNEPHRVAVPAYIHGTPAAAGAAGMPSPRAVCVSSPLWRTLSVRILTDVSMPSPPTFVFPLLCGERFLCMDSYIMPALQECPAHTRFVSLLCGERCLWLHRDGPR